MTEGRPIVIVDDDELHLAVAGTALKDDGYSVECFADASRALEHCAREAPALVLSDVIMPGCGGFELQAEYKKRFPERTTPFVFLSSLGDAGVIVRGLDAGADDFLRKPIEPAVLKAKVRAILRSRRPVAASSFRGDLARFPLPTLLRFCETHGLTGYVDVFVGDVLLGLRFKAGQIDDPEADATLRRMAEIEAAPFVVHSCPIDFAELGDRHAARRSIPPGDRPIGRVSSVRLSKRLFQIQTEVLGDDPLFIVSVVSLDGRTVWKHSERGPVETASAMAARVDAQHDRIEQKVNDTFARQLLARKQADPGRREEFHRLFDEGFDRFRERDYAAAIAIWERALEIDPTSSSLRVNIRVAHDKTRAK